MADSDKYNYEGVKQGSLPELDPHSLVKHNILRDYILKYILTLMSNANIPQLELTLVDAFCGAGLFQPDYYLANAYSNSSTEIFDGSPLIMLKAVEEARALVNMSRTKPRRIVVNYIFADIDKEAVEGLHYILQSFKKDNPAYTHSDNHIQVQCCSFNKLLPNILSNYKNKPKKRVLFFLDQYAYKNVPIFNLSQILHVLPNSEILMTFNIGSLTTYISDHASNKKALENIGLGDSIPWEKISEIKTNEAHWKPILQSYVAQGIHNVSGSNFITPFFIRPLAKLNKPSWEYWLVHLSNHLKAHDVMKGIHWQYSNCASHELRPGIWEQRYDTNLDPLVKENSFLFTPQNKDKSNLIIAEYLAEQVYAQNDSISVSSLIHDALPKSTGTVQHMNESLAHLVTQKEVLIFNKDGGKRGAVKTYDESDVVIKNPQIKMIY